MADRAADNPCADPVTAAREWTRAVLAEEAPVGVVPAVVRVAVE